MTSPATLTTGLVRPHLIALTVPMIWGIAAMMTFNIVDTWFVAQLGEKELAAMSFTFPVVMTLVSLGIGMMAGTASIISRVLGRGNMQRVRRLTTDAALLAFIIAILFSVIGLLSMDWVFKALGAEEEILPLIKDYMITWYYGYVFILMPMVGLGAVRATGDSKLQSRILILASIMNLILDPLLIFGLWGFPELGIQGAALATVISRGLSFVMGYWALHFNKRMITYELPTWHELKASWGSILHVGLPAAGTNIIIPLAGGVIVALVAQFGVNAVAGFGAATRIEQMTLVVFYAMSAMIGPFVGQNLGAEKYHRIGEAMNLCGRFCLVSGLFIAVLLALSASFLMRQFSDDQQVIDVGVLYLWIVPISFGLEGVVMVANAAFNGVGRPLPGVVISVLRMVLLYLPLAYVFSLFLGVAGIFIGAALANIISGIVAWWWFERTCRLHLVSPKNQQGESSVGVDVVG